MGFPHPQRAGNKQYRKEQEDSHLKPFLLSVKVTNALIDSHSMLQLHDVVQTNFVVSRLMGSDGKFTIPKSSTAIHTGDILLVVCSAHDAERFKAVIGPEVEMDWESTPHSRVLPAYSGYKKRIQRCCF